MLVVTWKNTSCLISIGSQIWNISMRKKVKHGILQILYIMDYLFNSTTMQMPCTELNIAYLIVAVSWRIMSRHRTDYILVHS